MNKNVVSQNFSVSRDQRSLLLGHKSFVIWFTGLSGSGKSTLANGIQQRLFEKGKLCYVLDGDNVRLGLNQDLGFSEAERKENIRRVSEVAKLMIDAGIIVITAFISPFQADRQKARQIIGEKDFLEIFIDCPVEVCENRDVKGLYKKARSGQISDFTGISSPYEKPSKPFLTVQTDSKDLATSLDEIESSLTNYFK